MKLKIAMDVLRTIIAGLLIVWAFILMIMLGINNGPEKEIAVI